MQQNHVERLEELIKVVMITKKEIIWSFDIHLDSLNLTIFFKQMNGGQSVWRIFFLSWGLISQLHFKLMLPHM